MTFSIPLTIPFLESFGTLNGIGRELSENHAIFCLAKLTSEIRSDGVSVERFVVDGIVALSSNIAVDGIAMQSIPNSV